MRSVLVILAVVLFNQVFGYTDIKIEKCEGKDGEFPSIDIKSENNNANVNDINVGPNAGNGGSNIGGGTIKIPKIAFDTDTIDINIDGDDITCDGKKETTTKACAAATTTTRAAQNPTDPTTTAEATTTAAPTTTTTATTTTVSPNCTCQYYSIIDDKIRGTCTFWADDAQAHCDQKGYSLCRAVCVAAMALNWEDCTPELSTYLKCSCPILGFEGGIYQIPYNIPRTSRVFYDSRYKACYRECRTKKEEDESTYEDDNTGNKPPLGVLRRY